MLRERRFGETRVEGGKRPGDAAPLCRPPEVAAPGVSAADAGVGRDRQVDSVELESLFDVAGLCTATVSQDYRIKACRYTAYSNSLSEVVAVTLLRDSKDGTRLSSSFPPSLPPSLPPTLLESPPS